MKKDLKPDETLEEKLSEDIKKDAFSASDESNVKTKRGFKCYV